MTDTDVLEALAANISRLMAEQGVSQRKLSALTDTPLMTINGMVNGRHMPGAGLVHRVAEALGVAVETLYEATHKKTSRRA